MFFSISFLDDYPYEIKTFEDSEAEAPSAVDFHPIHELVGNIQRIQHQPDCVIS